MSEVIKNSLIELLFWYRDLVKSKDRAVANRAMHKTCNEDLWFYIEGSVSDDGEFIDAQGNLLNLEEEAPIEETKEEEKE